MPASLSRKTTHQTPSRPPTPTTSAWHCTCGGGKGKKDRDLPLPKRLLHLVREQYRQFRPVTLLFEGQLPGKPYSERSLQLVGKQAADQAGIRRPVTPHMLEAGTDILRICSVML
ncbi:tyrosine-type recombinase/integrase [Hymenobacter coalescens]